jgi:hypothetical protein
MDFQDYSMACDDNARDLEVREGFNTECVKIAV